LTTTGDGTELQTEQTGHGSFVVLDVVLVTEYIIDIIGIDAVFFRLVQNSVIASAGFTYEELS